MSLKILKDSLIREGIVKIKNKDEEPFTLNELGTKSRLFFDIKEASLNPNILNSIVNHIIDSGESPAFLNMCYRSAQDYYQSNYCIASIAIGGIPISTVLSNKTRIPQIIIRNDDHSRGTKNKIIGNCKNKHVLFIEDVSVTGNAIIKGVKAIREAGGDCNTCIVVVDREEGAFQNCKENGIFLVPLLKKSDFGINPDEEK